MFINLHAVVILATVIVPLCLIARDCSWHPRRLQKVAVPVFVMVGMGILCLSLLSVFGVPITEWVFPAVGAILAGLFLKSHRTFTLTSWSLVVVAVVLCINSCLLKTQGYTAAPDTTRAMHSALEQAFVQSLSTNLRDAFPPDKLLLEAPVDTILPGSEQSDWDRKTVGRLWHTWFTGLYEIRSRRGDIWYPGGPVGPGSKKLLWKPDCPKAKLGEADVSH
jgi:hypothetical protein